MESRDGVNEPHREWSNSSAVSRQKSSSGFVKTWRRIVRLSRKELRESLRDKRTLVTLIMMPLIVYPLLGSVVQKFAVSRIDPNAPAAIVIFDTNLTAGLQTLFPAPPPDNSPAISEPAASAPDTSADNPDGTNDEDSTAEQQMQKLTSQLSGGQSPLSPSDIPVRLERYVQPPGTDLESLIREAQADVAIRELLPVTDPVTGRVAPGRLEILSRKGDSFSSKAAEEVERKVRQFRDDVVRSILNTTRFGDSVMPSVSRIPLESTAPKESPLSAFVPLMLVLMTMTGAVYPAIDLTAGERERGTLEMLMAAPVPRRDLLTGKFVAVFVVAVLTALINLTAMILTLYGTGFDRVILGDGATIGMFLQVLSLLVVFASFFSAVLLCITSFARSFREAQAWLIPLMLVSLAPGILSLMPGVRLTLGLALIPLVNIVLLGKELFQGIASPFLFVVTLLATVTYTVLALQVAARVFGSDTVLFGSQSAGSGLSRRATELKEHVPFRLGLGWMIVLVPTFIVVSGLRGRIVSPANLAGQLVLSGVILFVLFGLLPVLLTIWNRIRFASAFAMRGFSPLALLGAVLLGLTLWTLTYEALLLGKGTSVWTQFLSNPALKEMAERLTRDTPLLLRLITLAAIPAVCEEMFFRGFLISALKGGSAQWTKPLFVSTFLFAAFHVIVGQSLTLERFPATFMLGLVLGWIRLTTGSVIPGMAMHAVSNALLLSLSDLQPVLARLGLDLAVENETHLPAWFLVTCACISLCGALLIARSGTMNPKQTVAR